MESEREMKPMVTPMMSGRRHIGIRMLLGAMEMTTGVTELDGALGQAGFETTITQVLQEKVIRTTFVTANGVREIGGCDGQ